MIRIIINYAGNDGLWGLKRTSSAKSNSYTQGLYHFDEHGGSNVTVYIADTGIYTEHHDFEGRAVTAFVAENLGDEGETDLQGHGTHVAGTVGGSLYGIAKKVNLVSVKVLFNNSTFTSSTLAAGLEAVTWICTDFANKRQRDKKYKAVVNASLGLPMLLPTIEQLVTSCTDSGLTFVNSAGNKDVDACTTSPARVSSVITVGATDRHDKMADFSNYGSCVDILAPGVDVLSAGIAGIDSTAIMSGTSMAAPHVTGVIARYLSGHHENPSPHQIKAWLLDMAAKDDIEIDVNKMTTANRMLYMPCASGRLKLLRRLIFIEMRIIIYQNISPLFTP